MSPSRPVQVLILETDLDRSLNSSRSQIPFMRGLFCTFPGVELVTKQVHSRADLVKFLDEARSQRVIEVIHLIAHGLQSATQATVILTKDEPVDLRQPENRQLFRGFRNRVLIFSCCQLGRDAELMRRLLRLSGARAVFSYTDDVKDRQAYLTEALLYHLLFRRDGKPLDQSALIDLYQRLRFALPFLKVDGTRDALIDPLLTADVRLGSGEFWSSDAVVAL